MLAALPLLASAVALAATPLPDTPHVLVQGEAEPSVPPDWVLAEARDLPPSLLAITSRRGASQKDNERMARLSREEGTQWVLPVVVNRDAIKSDEFRIDLSDRQVVVQELVVEPPAQEGHWFGYVAKDSDEEIYYGPTREVSFMLRDDGGFVGEVHLGDYRYEVKDLSPSEHVLVKRRIPVFTDLVFPPSDAENPRP